MPRPMPISVPLTDLNLVPVPNLRFRVPCAVPGQGSRLKKVPVPFLRREKRGRRLDVFQAAAFMLPRGGAGQNPPQHDSLTRSTRRRSRTAA